MNFFLAFFDKKHKEEDFTAPQKANMEVEICRENKLISKKKLEKVFFHDFFFNCNKKNKKENSTALLNASVKVEIC